MRSEYIDRAESQTIRLHDGQNFYDQPMFHAVMSDVQARLKERNIELSASQMRHALSMCGRGLVAYSRLGHDISKWKTELTPAFAHFADVYSSRGGINRPNKSIYKVVEKQDVQQLFAQLSEQAYDKFPHWPGYVIFHTQASAIHYTFEGVPQKASERGITVEAYEALVHSGLAWETLGKGRLLDMTVSQVKKIEAARINTREISTFHDMYPLVHGLVDLPGDTQMGLITTLARFVKDRSQASHPIQAIYNDMYGTRRENRRTLAYPFQATFLERGFSEEAVSSLFVNLGITLEQKMPFWDLYTMTHPDPFSRGPESYGVWYKTTLLNILTQYVTAEAAKPARGLDDIELLRDMKRIQGDTSARHLGVIQIWTKRGTAQWRNFMNPLYEHTQDTQADKK